MTSALVSTNRLRFESGQRALSLGAFTKELFGHSPDLPDDALDTSCHLEKSFSGSTYEARSLRVRFSDTPNWIKNIQGIISDSAETINPASKRMHRAEFSIVIDGDHCDYPAEVRVSGDFKDHIGRDSFVSSIDVRLLEGNLDGFTRFKLLLPETRGGVAEVLTSQLFRELGYLSPRSGMVQVDFNGTSLEMIYQENAEKEFLESQDVREAPIFEFDELTGWMLPFDNKAAPEETSATLLFFPRMSNSGWATLNSATRQISFRAANIFSNIVRSTWRPPGSDNWGYGGSDLPWYANLRDSYISNGNEHLLSELREFRALGVALGIEHHFHGGNRRFVFDILMGGFRPIYYDGNPTLDWVPANVQLLEEVEVADFERVRSKFNGLNQGEFISSTLKLIPRNHYDEVEKFLERTSENLESLHDRLVQDRRLQEEGFNAPLTAESLEWGLIGETRWVADSKFAVAGGIESGIISEFYQIGNDVLNWSIPVSATGDTEIWLRNKWYDSEKQFLGFDTTALAKQALSSSVTMYENVSSPPLGAKYVRFSVWWT